MACCNVRTLSLISASVQLAVWIIIIILSCFLSIAANDDKVQSQFQDSADAEAIIQATKNQAIVNLISGLISIPILVTLIVGIKQNRIRLVRIYVYLSYIGYGLVVFGFIVAFVLGIIEKTPIGDLFIELLIRMLYVAFSLLFFAPIFIYYRRMVTNPILPEQQGLNTNYPLQKSNYDV